MVALVYTAGEAGAAIGGPICNVPTDYSTIQAAIDDAGCTTINVAAGSYGNFTANRPVTINGAQAGADVDGRTFGSGVESRVDGRITISGAGVTLDGFSITESVATFAAFGVIVKPGADGAVIQHNIIDTVSTADTGPNGTSQGIFLENDPTPGVDGADDVQILANRIETITSDRAAKAILIGVNGGSDPSTNTLIQGNDIGDVISFTRGAYAVLVNNTAGVTGLQIVDNNIYDVLAGTVSGGWAHAISLDGDTPGANINGNTISNVTDATAPTDAAAVFYEANPSFVTTTVNFNSLDVGSATAGIALHPNLVTSHGHLGSLDGTCNWWGAQDGPAGAGPGSGSPVGTNVDFAPWLTAPGGDCVGPDADDDGVTDAEDNCPVDANPGQGDVDNDGTGDACDPQIGPPTSEQQCYNGGWALFNYPKTFTSQRACTSFVQQQQGQGGGRGGNNQPSGGR